MNKIKNYLVKIKAYIISHKVISVIALIVILLLGFWIYKKASSNSGETSYAITAVEKGTIISSVSGTGQVSASNQVDLKAKASGDIVAIAVKSGQKVKKGTLIAQIDSGDMQKSLRDAELSLQSSKLSLEKALIQNSEANRNSDLQKAYEDGFTAVSDAFLDLPTVLTGLEDVLNDDSLSNNTVIGVGKTAVSYLNQAEKTYYDADDSFREARNSFRLIDRNSSDVEISETITKTYNAVKKLTDALKSTKNLADYLAEEKDDSSSFASVQNSLSQYISIMSAHLSNLYSAGQDIKTGKEDFSTTDLDLESSRISVQQKENALQDLREELSDYYVRAPFDGTVADIAIEKSDSVNSGTIISTFITESKIAEIPFNEVDIAQIESGQKVILTFDAITDLTISGEVAEVDSVGTVSSGVVNYDVKINFDTQDSRIKPGMSVTADITTNTAKDVLVAPSSAVKTKNGKSYIEVFDKSLIDIEKTQGTVTGLVPEKRNVKVGLSDDTRTEIVSGISEGEIIVVKTVVGASASSSSTTPSILSSMKPSSGSSKSSTASAGGPPPGM
jgi:HlyD family secretion protein